MSSSSSSSSSDEENEILEEYFDSLAPRRPRQIRDRPAYFDLYDNLDFMKRFRLRKCTVEKLYQKIGHKINPDSLRNHAVPGMVRLLMALRFYATGNFLISVADFSGVSKASAVNFVRLVTDAIGGLGRELVVFPNSREELKIMKNKFFAFAKFPNAIGAIDCTHVKIMSPGGTTAENFRNRKGYFSLNVQMICDANMRILDCVARYPGSVHDQRIFNNSRIMGRLEAGEFGDGLILGDSGYENRSYLVTPLLTVTSPAERLYNESQIRSRNVVERTYGVLKRRFPILAIGMRCQVELVADIVHATTVLHNLAINEGIDVPDSEVTIDVEEGVITVPPLAIGNDRTRRGIINNYFAKL